jgi:hypothetical protein
MSSHAPRRASRLPAPPPSLAAADADQLSGLVAAALADQRRQTAEAVERAIEHVPRLLRGPVRKVLGV